ncbi:MAG: hypothetical protein H7336_09920, partial [Bacteriovorax sp.]|nr:hypothetical protein [Bacteriovorax sp.]
GTNCLNSSTPISYAYSTLTIGSIYYWSVGLNFLNPNNNTWLFENGEISLMRVGGNFDEIGKGF